MLYPRTLVSRLALLVALAFSSVTRADEPPAAAQKELGPDDPMPLEDDHPAAAHDAGMQAPETPVNPKAYAADLRALLAKVRERVIARAVAKLTASQEAQVERLGDWLFYLSLAGLLLLFRPLYLQTLYPGKTWPLFKYSVVAAGTFFIAVQLFSLSLLLLRSVQASTSEGTNPKIAVLEGAFDTLDHNAEHLAEIGPLLIEPTLAQLDAGEEEPIQVLLVDNLARLHQSATVFQEIAGVFRSVDWVFGLVPYVLTLLAAALFVKSFWPVLREVVALPERAVTGEPGIARKIVGVTFRKIGRELLSVLVLIVTFIAVTLLSGIALSLLVEPAMEAVIAFLTTTFLYLQVDPDAATGLILVAIAGVGLFLVANIAAVTLSSAFFLSRVQAIFRQRFHEKVPLRAHARFWKRGTVSLVWAQLLLVLFVLGALPIVKWIFGAFLDGEHPSFVGAMLAASAVLFLGLLLVYFVARGFRALLFLIRYKRSLEQGDTEIVTKVPSAA